MPNLDPWINQQSENNNNQIIEQEKEANSNFENYLLSYRAECKNTIERNTHQHPTFLERYQKIIEMLDWSLNKYGIIIQENKIQQHEKQKYEQDIVIIKRIIEELDEKKKIAKKNITKSELRDEVAMYRLEETTIEDVLFEIGEFLVINKLIT